jgi:hypothetical protein
VIDPVGEGARCGTAVAAVAAALEDLVPVVQRLLDRETIPRKASEPASPVRRLVSKELLTLVPFHLRPSDLRGPSAETAGAGGADARGAVPSRSSGAASYCQWSAPVLDRCWMGTAVALFVQVAVVRPVFRLNAACSRPRWAAAPGSPPGTVS